MGIRFDCPNGHSLHVKSFLGGKRGICPECGVKIDIPGDSARPPLSDQHAGKSSRKKTSKHADILASAGNWFIQIPSGEQFGPADEATFQDWVAQGRVDADCLIWREGWPKWRHASSVLQGQSNKGQSSKGQSSKGQSSKGTASSIQHPHPVDSTQTQSAPESIESATDPPIQTMKVDNQASSAPTPTSSHVRIETDRPVPKPRRKSRSLLYGLLVACLFLVIPLVYVLTRS